MALIYRYMSESRYYLKSKGSMTPKGICVHNTANNAPASNEINYMINNNQKVSYHIAIDDKESIVALPFNRQAYHAGDGNGPGNKSHISIEICYSLSGGPKFEIAEKRAAKEIASLLKKYKWGIEKVKKHQDFSGKYCPHRTLDMGWERFIGMIKANMDGTSTDNVPTITADPNKNITLDISKTRNDDALKECKPLENIKGIILYCEPKHFKYNDSLKIAHTDGAVQVVVNNGLSSNQGYHYVIDTERIDNCVPEDKATAHNVGEPTYISKALYDGKPNDCTLSVLITVPNETGNDYDLTERLGIKLVAYLLVKHGLKSDNVFRGFDLSRQGSLLHLLEQSKWRAFIEGVDKVYNEIAREKYTESFLNTLKISMDDREIKEFYYKNQDVGKYIANFEPDHRGIEAIVNYEGKPGEIQNFSTANNTDFSYSITENIGVGSDHCTRAYDTVVGKAEPKVLDVEPIYPDIIVPPGGTVTLVDTIDKNNVIENSNVPLTADEFEKRQKTFNVKDYKNAKKTIKGKPVNNNDPFPVDEKILELQCHMPKVKVDEVNFKLHDCNHPGSIIGPEVAKNFAMVQDEIITIAKRTERRLVRMENTMATVLRNLWRLSSRMQINCVYYGGQDVFGKYKCIRCLHDDRINDGQSMTVDQCLSCTRYEPILGQIYAILDETGTNIAQVLDDVQMSYGTLDDYISLTRVEEMHTERKIADVREEVKETPKPFKDEWTEGFKMDWNTVQLETQKANINEYKTEGIEINKPTIESDFEKVPDKEFQDTREPNDKYESLKFNSDDYEFKGFGGGEDISSAPPTDGSFGMGATETRNKIIEKAEEILALCKAGKAGYSQIYRNRTVNGILYHDCSSLIAACYQNAGLSFGTYTGDQYPLCYNKVGGVMMPSSEIDKLIPGDVIFYGKNIPADPNNLTAVGNITHISLYVGDGMMIHAANSKRPLTNQIAKEKWNYDSKVTAVLARPKCLVDVDKKAQESGSSLSGNDAFWNLDYHKFNKTIIDGALKYADSDIKILKERMAKYGYRQAVIDSSKKYNHDPYMILALICTESTGDPTNRTGGYWGLMQTEAKKTRATSNLNDIKHDIDLGCSHLTGKYNAIKHKYPDDVVLALHAYNAGQGTVLNGLRRSGYVYNSSKKAIGGEVADPIAKEGVRTWGQYKYSEISQYFAKILVRYIKMKNMNLLGL